MHKIRTIEEIDHQIDKYGQIQVGFERMLVSVTQPGEESSQTDRLLLDIANDNICNCINRIHQLRQLRDKLR